jgi:hypothetical protein
MRSIRHNDVLTAMLMNTLDEACAYLQHKGGITSGDVAAQVFAGFDWQCADLTTREAMLRKYIAAEQVYRMPEAAK